jgi:hypothetical protein
MQLLYIVMCGILKNTSLIACVYYFLKWKTIELTLKAI